PYAADEAVHWEGTAVDVPRRLPIYWAVPWKSLTLLRGTPTAGNRGACHQYVLVIPHVTQLPQATDDVLFLGRLLCGYTAGPQEGTAVPWEAKTWPADSKDW